MIFNKKRNIKFYGKALAEQTSDRLAQIAYLSDIVAKHENDPTFQGSALHLAIKEKMEIMKPFRAKMDALSEAVKGGNLENMERTYADYIISRNDFYQQHGSVAEFWAS